MIGKIKYLYNVDLNFKLALNIVIVCIVIIILKQFSLGNTKSSGGIGYFPPVTKASKSLNNNAIDLFKRSPTKKLKAIASLDEAKIEKSDQHRIVFTEKDKFK